MRLADGKGEECVRALQASCATGLALEVGDLDRDRLGSLARADGGRRGGAEKGGERGEELHPVRLVVVSQEAGAEVLTGDGSCEAGEVRLLVWRCLLE